MSISLEILNLTVMALTASRAAFRIVINQCSQIRSARGADVGDLGHLAAGVGSV